MVQGSRHPWVRTVPNPDKVNLASPDDLVPYLRWDVISRLAADHHGLDDSWAESRREAARGAPAV